LGRRKVAGVGERRGAEKGPESRRKSGAVKEQGVGVGRDGAKELWWGISKERRLEATKGCRSVVGSVVEKGPG